MMDGFYNEHMEDSVQGLLVMLIHQYHTKCFKQMGKLGVHPGQIPILMALHYCKGASQKQLVELLHVKPPTVTVAVQRLEKAGLARREQDSEDQRVSRIFLTEKGEATSMETLEIYRNNERDIVSGFTEEEFQLMRQLLKRMVDNIGNISIKEEGDIHD